MMIVLHPVYYGVHVLHPVYYGVHVLHPVYYGVHVLHPVYYGVHSGLERNLFTVYLAAAFCKQSLKNVGLSSI